MINGFYRHVNRLALIYTKSLEIRVNCLFISTLVCAVLSYVVFSLIKLFLNKPIWFVNRTPSLSQTIWPRWASTQFLSLPIVQTLIPETFGYSQSSEAVVMRQLRRWKSVWRRSLTGLHKRDFHWAFQKLLERYSKCIAVGGDYFEVD